MKKALELPDEGGKKLMEYTLSKKVTLCGPSMLLYFKSGRIFLERRQANLKIFQL